MDVVSMQWVAAMVLDRPCTRAEAGVHPAFRQPTPQCGCRRVCPLPPVHRILPVLLVLPLLMAQPPVAMADGQRDHDRARAALRAGEVLPLAAILERVARQQSGQVLDVELEREHGRWIYELKLLRDDGALVKLEVDALDGRVMRRKRDGKREGVHDGMGGSTSGNGRQ